MADWSPSHRDHEGAVGPRGRAELARDGLPHLGTRGDLDGQCALEPVAARRVSGRPSRDEEPEVTRQGRSHATERLGEAHRHFDRVFHASRMRLGPAPTVGPKVLALR